MAKEDFCFTYYDGDAARDKAHMNRLQRGAYDDIISAQRKRGHLSLEDIKMVLSGDFETCWPALGWVLKQDEDGKFFIEWVDQSINKREAYIISRRKNKGKSLDGMTYVYLMKDEFTGLCKIGSSLEPEKRIKEIQKYAKAPLKNERNVILLGVSGLVDKSVEFSIHKLFERKRVEGEWFNFDESDIKILISKYICSSYDKHMVDGNGDENETGSEPKGGTGENNPIPVVVEMKAIWLELKPGYPQVKNSTDDEQALFAIGDFIAQQFKIPWLPHSTEERAFVVTRWRALANWILADDFYRSWALITLSSTKSMKTIWQKSNNGTTQKTSGKLSNGKQNIGHVPAGGFGFNAGR